MGRLGFDHYIAPLSLYLQRYRENQGDLRSGLHGEDFSIIKHRHRPPITDTISALVHHAKALQIRSSMPPLQLLLPPPPSSSLNVPPSAPPPPINHRLEQGSEAGYFRWTSGGGNGAGTSNSEAPPMPDFFP